MNTLNTIIEGEKKEFWSKFAGKNTSLIPMNINTWLTTAMQRAYETGRADSAHENTPDIEWEKEFEKLMPEVSYEFCQGHLNDGIAFISNLLTSRDTYWKERVRVLVSKNTGEDEFDVVEFLNELNNLK